MFTAADVSVVIPSYKSRPWIEACLDSLLAQEEAPREIIVVDSSMDGSCELIRDRYPQVRLHWMEKQSFPGPARNLGAGMATGAILAFIDADCVAAPDWVKRIAAAHSEGRQVVGGAVEVGNRASSVAWAGHLGEFREFLPAGSPRPMTHIPTCNISYRKCLFEARGGFPDAYYPQEDLLFNYLLTRQGVQIWFDPAIRVRHYTREDLRSFLSHQHRIGRVTRATLRRIDLSGSAFARNGWLAWGLSPVLGLVKFARTTFIFIRQHPGDALRRPDLIYLLALGAIWWSRGFAAGARRGLSGIRGWDDPEEPIFAQLVAARRQEGPP